MPAGQLYGHEVPAMHSRGHEVRPKGRLQSRDQSQDTQPGALALEWAPSVAEAPGSAVPHTGG